MPSLGAVLIGTLLTFGMAEAGLRLVGLGLSIARTASPEAPYVVLAEGDSFTYGIGGRSFPAQLEVELNRRAGERLFRVVNRGVPGSTTTNIADALLEHIQQDAPDIVLVTTGENNGWNVLQLDTEDLTWGETLHTLAMRSRVLRFVTVAWAGYDQPNFHEGAPTLAQRNEPPVGYGDKAESIGLDSEREQRIGERDTEGPFLYTPEQREQYEQAWLLRDDGDYEASIALFDAVIAAQPHELAAYTGRAGSLMRLSRDLEAAESLVAAVQGLPDGAEVPPYVTFVTAHGYRRAGEVDKASATLVRGIERYPTDDMLFHGLADLHHRERGSPWPALELVAHIEGIEHNHHHGWLTRLSQMTAGYANHTYDGLLSKSFQHDMRTMARLAREHDIAMVWSSYPTHAYDEVEQVAAEFDIPYIDFRPLFAERFEDETAFLAADGCHCNTQGYALMAEVFADAILDTLGVETP